jgi:glycosyltransferase involved in cell wall biosynthesis
MAQEKVSVILPVYNEETVLRKNVNNLRQILERMLDDFEIIISEDGSTDKTPEIAKSLQSEKICILHGGKRRGKGAAIKNAAAHAKGKFVIFMDADLASDPVHIKQVIKLLDSGAAIVIGSRYLEGSKANRTPLRHFASKSFNFLVKLMLGSKLTDHQCGFKAFRKDLVIPVINEVEDERWFWDTEFLIRCQRKGLKIVEMPIEWKECSDSKFRLFEDTYHMAHSLLSFKLKHR